MACKSCKKNNGGLINNLLGNPRERLFKNNMNKPLLNDIGISSVGENIVLLLFAWIPLAVGYYHIVRFIINLF